MKRPSFQFYPGDWMNDAALRMVSIGARGLWIDMLCIMHQGSEYGHLKVNGKVILPANLSRMCGATLPEVEGWLSELSDAGVFSVDDDGGIFSRRMIRDEQIRKARADGGFKGGNPNLMKKSAQVFDPPKVNLDSNLQPTPSSSSSSSSSSSDNNNKNIKRLRAKSEEIIPPQGVNREAWGEWVQFRKRKKKPISEDAAQKQFKLLLRYTHEQQRQVIEKSISSDYQGLFEPRGDNSNATFDRPARQDNSAAGRVRANIARERAQQAAAEGRNTDALANDELDVWAQVDRVVQ